ncbi:K(+)-transporting ATPase subunit F [Afifella sp. IM 167]|nr:K(+)-transporting ATPase subunit F [Afifella sp. IM 167]
MARLCPALPSSGTLPVMEMKCSTPSLSVSLSASSRRRHCRSASSRGFKAMVLDLVLGGLVALALLAYLVWALLNPEKL